PFSPRRAWTSPGYMSKSTRSLARIPGKDFVIPRSATSGSTLCIYVDRQQITRPRDLCSEFRHPLEESRAQPPRVLAPSLVDLEPCNAHRVQEDAADIRVFDLQLKETREVVPLDRIDCVVVDEVTARIQNRPAPVNLDPLDRVVGVPPVQVGAQIDQLVRQRPRLRCRWSPVRANMRAHDDQVRGRSGLGQ